MQVTSTERSAGAGRLQSLDLLRGADIFFLSIVCALVKAAHRLWTLGMVA